MKTNKKKVVVHDVFSSHNDVHLWNVYQIKKWKKKKKKSVDALIVHVVRLVGLTSSSDCLTDVWAGS